MKASTPHLRAAEVAAAALVARFGNDLVAVALFGSVARGRERPDSDVDLLVVMRELPAGMSARRRLLEPCLAGVEGALRREQPFAFLSIVARTPDEVRAGGPLYYDMTVPDEVVLLHDPQAFLGGFLADLRARMEALGSRRRYTPTGQPWWDLKPDWRPGDRVEL